MSDLIRIKPVNNNRIGFANDNSYTQFTWLVLPFANVAETIILDGQQNKYDKYNYNNSTNNDMLTNIDLYVNNMNLNSLKNQCKHYDTSI